MLSESIPRGARPPRAHGWAPPPARPDLLSESTLSDLVVPRWLWWVSASRRERPARAARKRAVLGGEERRPLEDAALRPSVLPAGPIPSPASGTVRYVDTAGAKGVVCFDLRRGRTLLDPAQPGDLPLPAAKAPSPNRSQGGHRLGRQRPDAAAPCRVSRGPEPESTPRDSHGMAEGLDSTPGPACPSGWSKYAKGRCSSSLCGPGALGAVSAALSQAGSGTGRWGGGDAVGGRGEGVKY